MAGRDRDKKPAANTGYQFKVTLADAKPTIWRRLLVPDGTLDELHEWIQTAMGWTNTHLHHFEIGRKRYGDPSMLEDDLFGDPLVDTLSTQLSDLFDKPRPPKKFTYEYDFGDGWLHELQYEGLCEAPPRKKLPLCLEGERACPPEDCGGVWGYYHLLEVLADPKHEEHEHYAEWAPDGIDPDKFSPSEATKAMRRGLPSWRD